MKKMLLLVMCLPTVLAAQNGVTVSALNVNSGTVTFNVSWNKNAPELKTIVWLDSVWVFVDYNAAGVMTRLPLSAGATLTYTSAPDVGRVIQYPDNNKGVWVVGNAKSGTNTSGSFSATVELLTATAAIAGACAYASNYPPVGEYITAQTIKFIGTPPYDLVLNTGSDQAYGNYNLLSDQKLLSFIDKTGAPGIIIPKPISLTANPAVICSGASATLTAVAAGAASYSFDNGATWQAGATKVVSLTANTTYTLKVLSATSYVSSDSKTATMTVNALPTDPTGVNNARCGDGTVTISATSSGAVIDWYAISSGGSSVSTGTSYTTPNITATKTYYAQARNNATGCVSASRTAVIATRNNVPAIARTGGAASQTVYKNVPITNIVYTASNGATAIALSSGSWPSGITGATSGLSYTIAGSTSDVGTTNYTIKATGEGSCTYTTSGAITVLVPPTPPLAASTKTWVITGNGVTQTWSDRINVPDCDKDSYANDYSNPQCRSRTLNSVKYYYYNWPYVNANQNTMCPPGNDWRVPTVDDFVALDIALGGTGAAERTVSYAWFSETYLNTWGGEQVGLCQNPYGCVNDDMLVYWASTAASTTASYGLQYTTEKLNVQKYHNNTHAFQVRCVK